ncbi:MAG TPA: ATP-binding cassette domain-containing protein [Xanthobacteraceae bacterium]|nr:ATP-binding cassette domain-containing protein [Xanthobacteraceae bacterium]
MNEHVIALHDVVQRFPGAEQAALSGISLEIRQGEFVAIVGPSGSGKTTLLRLVNRLANPSAGEVLVEGEAIAASDPVRLRRRIGYVFQGIGLFPHMSVAENISITPRLLGWNAEKMQKRVGELLALVRLPDDYRSRMPDELSGGERQRVGVARALAAKPNIMLMDEPFGALDPVTRDALTRDYRALHEELGLTSLLITHDVLEALLLADRIVVLNRGCIVETGSPAELMRAPKHEFTRRLMEMPEQQAKRLAALLQVH